MRHLIIGDIHGCLNTLKELLNSLSLSPKDHIILLGDLVDRGPHSAGVVKHLFSLSKRLNVSLVRGNHEHKHIITMYYNHQFSNHGDIMQTQNQLSEEEREWLFSGDLFYRNKEKNFVCVHGGISEEMKKLPWPKFNDNLGQSQEWARKIMFLRREGDNLWAEKYDGRFGFAFFGHQVFEDPRQFPHAAGIDTGCVFGGKLTAAVLDSGELEFVSVENKD